MDTSPCSLGQRWCPGPRPSNRVGADVSARGLEMALAHRDTDERDHPSRGLVPLDGEPRLLEAYRHGLGGEPQLTVDALAEAPAVLLPDPDEVVHLHGAGLVLEEAGHDELVRSVERDHSIQVAQVSAEIAKREREPTTSDESRRHAVEDAREVGLALEMRERVAHADGQLDRRWHKLRDVADVAGDRLDRQAARPVPRQRPDDHRPADRSASERHGASLPPTDPRLSDHRCESTLAY